jgi:polysaccharide transporter, PST family
MVKTAINVASLFVSVVANRIFPILLFPILARVLGPESFGRYIQASALSFLLAQIVEWGFNMTAVRDVALAGSDRHKIGGIVSNVALSRGLIALTIVAATFALAPWLAPIFSGPAILAAAIAYGTLYAFDFRFAFYGLQRSGPFLVLSFGQYLVSFLLIVLLVRSPEDIWRALAIPASCSVAAALASLVLLRRHIMFVRPSFAEAFSLIRRSSQMFLTRNVFQAANQIGVLALGLFAPPQVVGWFGASERIVRTLGQLIIYPLQIGITPAILERSAKNAQAAVKIFLGSLAAACLAALAAGITLYSVAPLILTLVLGSANAESIRILKLLSVYPVLFILIHLGGITWLYLMNWDRENLTISLAYTAIFAAALLTAAWAWGLDGVVAALLASSVGLVLAYGIYFQAKGIGPWRRPLGEALRLRRAAKAPT